MAQLRQTYDQFHAHNAEVIVVGPDDAAAFQAYWDKHHLPFIGLPDPQHTMLKLYGQEIKLFKLGRMPAQAVVDMDGIVRYVHYGHSMQDIPENETILDMLSSG